MKQLNIDQSRKRVLNFIKIQREREKILTPVSINPKETVYMPVGKDRAKFIEEILRKRGKANDFDRKHPTPFLNK